MAKETCSTSEDMKIIEASTHPFVRLMAKLFRLDLDEEEFLVLVDIIQTAWWGSASKSISDEEMEAVENELHRREEIAWKTLLSKKRRECL